MDDICTEAMFNLRTHTLYTRMAKKALGTYLYPVAPRITD